MTAPVPEPEPGPAPQPEPAPEPVLQPEPVPQPPAFWDAAQIRRPGTRSAWYWLTGTG